MAAQSNFPLEIDESIRLFPIPGRLPANFFEDIPSDARAIFSTCAGTRPLRSLHTPIPVHLVGPRQGDHLEIDAKAWSLMTEYPELTESVTTPPMAWKDLYSYFDAVDIWKEGAGHLFYVLGFIYRVNRTRYNVLQDYVINWVSMNEEFVTRIPATEDVLSALSTESRDYFGMDKLNKRETEDLRLAIIMHRDALQRRQDDIRSAQIGSMRTRALRDPSIVSMERQRPYGSTTVNPYDCGPIHTYLRNIVKHPGTNDFQARSRSNSHYQNGDVTQFHEGSIRNSYTESMSTAETLVQFNGSQNNYLHGPQGPSSEMQGVSRGLGHLDPYGSHQVGFNGFNPLNPPIYVFNPQRPVGGYYGTNSTAESQRQEQAPSFRPGISFLPGRDQGRVTQVGRAPLKYEGISNDARLHRMSDYSQRRESISRELEPVACNQPFHRPHYSRDGFAQACTVFVGGFRSDGSSTDWVPELLSKCGKVVSFKALQGNRNSGFVTFDNVESTLRAIEQFNGFETFQGRYLTVAIPRQKSGNSNHGSHSSHNSGDMTRSSSQDWNQEGPPTRRRDHQYSDLRITGQAWSHSRNSSFHTTPPKYRSPVENNNNMAARKVNGKSTETASFSMQQAALHGGTKIGSAEDCFQTQLDTVAKAADYNKKIKETTPRKFVKSGGLSGQVSSTTKKRKIWTNKSNESATNISTQTPSKSVSTPRASSGTLGGARRDSLAGGIKRTTANSKSSSFENSQNAPGVNSVNESPPNQAPLMLGIMTSVQNKISNPLLASTKVSSERYIGKLRKVSSRPIQSESCAEFNEGGQNLIPSFASSLESGETLLSDNSISTDNFVKSSASNGTQRQPHFSPKRKRKNVKRFSRNSRSSIDKGSLSAAIVGISTEENAGANSEESFSRTRSDSGNRFSHVRSDSEATTVSAFSGLEMPLKAIQSGAFRDGKVMKNSTVAESVSTASNSSSSQASQSAKQGDTPNQANARSGDDVFSDNNKPSVRPSSMSCRQCHKKANSGSSGGSSTRLPGNRNQESSPTPGKRMRPSSQRKEPVKTDMEFERSKNDRAQLLVTQMLSDLTHWPELGSANPPAVLKSGYHQRTATAIRTFDPRVAVPRLPRRDTSASLVSESLQSTRSQTIESPGRTDSNSRELWPRVRRRTLQSDSPSYDGGSGPPSAEP